MKVCYVLPHFYPHVGGAEQAFMDLIKVLVKKNIEVRVVTSSSGGIVGHKLFEGIDIYYYNWKMFFGHPIVKKKDLEEHVRWADIVHSAVYSPIPPTSSVCKKIGRPHVGCVHEVLGKRWYWIESNKIKAFLFKKYEEYTVRQYCDIFITPSFATKTDLEKCNKKANVKNIYWISDNEKKTIKVDKEKFNNYFNIKSSDKVFLNYGRPGKTKGVFIYLDAIRKVVNDIDSKKLKNIKFCFIMAKDPSSERKKFLDEVNRNNLENYVIVRESVSREDLENYRACADYIVVPSITEGFGLTAIEACEASKKLIHSSGGSLPEVTFGETIQFENRNSEDLADKLKGIILGSCKFVKKEKKDFSKETISNEYINVYKSLIKEYENE
ncbi:MAG: glycosyltransferase family 4 protein [Bacilli bacterium]|nr:glycosyltransferase family 4 protein [Bacilli bacterium]